MKKWILIPCGLGAVVAGAAAALLVSINPSVEAGVNKFGPEITGTHVFLKEADISVFSGEGKLNEFLIGNPKGYTAPHALKVGSMSVALDKGTLAEDVIVIKKIAIDSPDIIYELGKKSNNFDDIIKNVEALGAARDKAGDVRDVRQQKCTVRMGDVRHAFEVDDTGIGRGPDRNQLRFFPRRHFGDFVVIDITVFADTVVNDIVELSGEIHRGAVRQMTAVSEIHRQNLIARLQCGKINRHIGLRTGMRLNVGMFGAEELLRAIDGQLLNLVHPFATAVPAFVRIAFGVLVRENAALRLHDGGERKVFGSNQLNMRLLAGKLAVDIASEFRIKLIKRSGINHGLKIVKLTNGTRNIGGSPIPLTATL